ncbi:MAG: response regulator, partial [Candidatus Electrothrix sp. ATG2]|nr:response regulator [Candidatus Electrothrix sp. ATG2]
GQSEQRVLIVEDNSENRLLLKKLLKRAGFAVREASNGQEAITVFNTWQPCFIWMDIGMPVLDGFEATRRIRALPGGSTVKIAALTASVFKEQHGKILAAGCDTVVHKPFRAGELFSVMEKYLGVRYCYSEEQKNKTEKTTAILTAAMLEELPAAQQKTLSKAAHKLDIVGTEEVIKEIRHDHPEIADGLQVLAQEFRFGHILELLKRDEK